MTNRTLRTAIVGAATLLGRELTGQIATLEPGWAVTLLDEEEAAGQMTSAGDEAAVIQPLTPGSLSDFEFVFFCADPLTASTHWPEVKLSGAVAVDLSGGLAAEPGFVILSPWITPSAASVDLSTLGIIAAHPAALLLALIAARLQPGLGAIRLLATAMQPASQYGKQGLDELHAQTAALLTFQSVPREVFDTQTAFNLLSAFGATAKHELAADSTRIRKHFAVLVGATTLELKLVQVPVFHGFAISIFVDSATPWLPNDIRKALEGDALFVVSEASLDEPGPSNQSAVEQEKILVAIDPTASSRGFWLWVTADNLWLSAKNAVACAQALARLRPPTGTVQ